MQNNSLVADFAKKRYYPTCLNVLLGNSGALRKVPVGLEVDLNKLLKNDSLLNCFCAFVFIVTSFYNKCI